MDEVVKERGEGILERVYTIPVDFKNIPKKQRARRAIKEIELFVQRHMKSDSVWIDNRINEIIWARGAENPPSKIKVKATKFEDGLVEVVPLEE
jgi:large subunit ribosomal protein L31e